MSHRDQIIQHCEELIQRYVPSDQRPAPLVCNTDLYVQALTHKGGAAAAPAARRSARHQHYERLEYLGDAVLYLAVAAYLHRRYPDADEGLLTRLRTKIVCGSTLASLCKRGTRFSDLLMVATPSGPRCMRDRRGGSERDVRVSTLEDVLEAFLGALHEDHGYGVAHAWLIGFLESHVDFADLVSHQDNPKDVLNRRLRTEQGHIPQYEALPVGADGVAHVRIRCRDGSVLSTGQGADLRAAALCAARKALAALGLSNFAPTPPCGSSQGQHPPQPHRPSSMVSQQPKFLRRAGGRREPLLHLSSQLRAQFPARLVPYVPAAPCEAR